MAELRRPKPAYMGRNGFAVSTSTPVSNIGASSKLQVEEAKKRRLAEWVLKVKGSHFPTCGVVFSFVQKFYLTTFYPA